MSNAALRTRVFFTLLTVFSFAACSGIFPKPPALSYYQLSLSDSVDSEDERLESDSPEESSESTEAALPFSLLLLDQTNDPFLNSRKIVYSSGGLKRSSYQLASWVESPSRQMTRALGTRLRNSGHYSSVAFSDSGAVADFSVNVRLTQFYHDTEQEPGSARVGVAVELVDGSSRTIITDKTFNHSAQLEAYNAESAVAALNKASRDALAAVQKWLRGELQRRAKQSGL